MNVLAIVSLVSASIAILLASLVYSNNRRDPVNRVFTHFCALLTYAAFTEFLFRQASDFDTALIWRQVGAFSPLLIASILHFTLVFTKNPIGLSKRFMLPALYLPALLLSIVTVITTSYSPDIMQMSWGWMVTYNSGTLAYINTSWYILITVTAIYIIWRYYFKQSSDLQKQQAKYVGIFITLPVIVGFITYSIQTVWNIHVPEMMTTTLAFGSAFIWYGVWKHRLFTIDVNTAAEDILSTMSDMLFLVDMKERIIKANSEAVKVTGYKQEELYSIAMEQLFPITGMDDGLFIGNMRDRALTLITKSKRQIQISMSISMLLQNNGMAYGWLFIARDITEREKAKLMQENYSKELRNTVAERTKELVAENDLRRRIENELQENVWRYNALFNNITDAVLVTDRTEGGHPGKFLDMNEAAIKMYGYSREELMEIAPQDLEDPEVHKNIEDRQRQFLTKGHAVFETMHIAENGRKFPVELSAHRFKHNGESLGISVVRDMTRRKKIQEDLRITHEKLSISEKLATVGQLASGVAHEIRNPLAVIGNGVYYLKLKVDKSDSDKMKFLDIMEREVFKSSAIIEGLLLFARTKQPLFTLVNIDSVIEEVSSYVAIDEAINVEIQCENDLPQIMADRSQQLIVFNNLIGNAVQSMLSGGSLSINCKQNDDFVVVSVQDTGVGIAPENIDRIFEPMFTTKQDMGGIGIGLAIVKTILDAHSASVEVQSDVGAGTTFTIKLPLGQG